MVTAKNLQAEFGRLAAQFTSAAVDVRSRSLPDISSVNRAFGESVGMLAKGVNEWLTEQRERTFAALSDALRRPSEEDQLMLARIFAEHELGEFAPLVLTETVMQSEGKIRSLAWRTLNVDFGEEAFQALMYVALHDRLEGCRAGSALRSLKGRDPCREEVELMLKNAAATIRGAREMLEWAARRDINIVRAVFRSADKTGQVVLLDVFGDLGEAAANAVPDLISSLSDRDAMVRGAAAIALKKIGPKAKDAVEALERLRVADVSEEVRGKAERALEAIRGSKK